MKTIGAVTGFLIVAGAAALPVACGSPTNGTCEETSSCATMPEGGEAGGDGGGDVQVPEGCDPKADVKDAPKCVVSDFGVFVDANSGSDGADGKKESPVKTIGAALGKLAGKSRIYICDGTYAEHVELTTAVSLYGGFACGAWTYSGDKPKIAPATPGFAVEIAGAGGEITLADLALTAPNATAKGQSSIAAFIHDATRVVVLRSDLDAGIAKEGDDGAAGTTGTLVSGDANGNPATGTTAGPIKTCACSSGGMSTGASGGGPLGAGAPGTPNLGGVAPVDGVGGLGNTSCVAAEPNGSGNIGADAANAADAAKITALGALDATGWKPQAGTAGVSGAPGQGGGGGGGRDATSAGGGGGCGGCGGTGGKGGAGGGASVALLMLNSTVVLRASHLTAKAAGQGGAGGAKGSGGTGGTGGIGGCGGGDGGRGGDGGSGGGGAGGISAAVLHKGPAPTSDASTLTPGTKGPLGLGGTQGTNDGPEGMSAPIVALP